jgi:RimJ/RimL family protein N-acetyltransferase
MNRHLHTERLLLRPWQERDAAALYQYAKDPAVGPICGWHIHTDEENSRQIIREVLSAEETYAIVPACGGAMIRKKGSTENMALTGNTDPIGSIGLMVGEKSNLVIAGDEGEIGFWIGVPYWGQGFAPEATQELMRHGFEDLRLKTIWCGYFDGNEKSKRAQEKCGFRFHHTEKDKPWPRMNDIRTLHVTCITKEQWAARPGV